MINKIRSRIITISTIISLFFISASVHAQEKGLVPCDGVDVPCDVNKVVELIQRIIEFVLTMVLPIAAIAFAYAGFLVMTSGGDPGKRKRGLQILRSVGTGIIIILAAWLIVVTILKTLIDPGAEIPFFDLKS